MKIKAEKYDDDDAYYAKNLADNCPLLNSLGDAPEIMKELRKATNEIILRQAKENGQVVIKVVVGSEPVRSKVGGYATFLSYVAGSSLADLEKKLGFRSGVLQEHGAYLYRVDPLSLNLKNIAPRGYTDWSAGVTPRDLDNLSKEIGRDVDYHRDFPAASMPIPQFVILEKVPYIGEPKFIDNGAIA